jgi:hypothetical protein
MTPRGGIPSRAGAVAAKTAQPSSSPIGWASEGEAGDVERGQVQLGTGDLTEELWGVQLVGAGPFENRREPIGGLVDDLRDLQDLLSASHVSYDAGSGDLFPTWVS